MDVMVPPEADITVAITADITEEITDRLLSLHPDGDNFRR